MSSELKVKPIPPNDGGDGQYKLDDRLPPHPSRVVILGSTGSGKSSWIYTALKDWYQTKGKPYYDVVMLFSPTMRYDTAWQTIPKVEIYGMSGWQEWLTNWIAEYEQIQEERVKRGFRKFRALCVFDDAVTKGISSHGRMGILDEVWVRGRNIGISCWIASQKFRKLNDNIRSLNVSHLVVYSVQRSEVDAVAEEHANNFLDAPELASAIRKAHETPFQYFLIDKRAPLDKQFRVGMDTVLDLKKKPGA